MQRASGEAPVLWGSMVGFGRYSYRTESGHEGEMFLTGFAPRKANMVVYVMPGFGTAADQLQALGPHKIGKSCLYLGRLSRNDLAVLERLVRASVTEMRRWHTAEGAGAPQR